jgi:1-acyl-sn-glycerol-3-phosphate acyltransferase
MSMNRYIKLRRGDRESVVQMMAECEQTIDEGNSIMMFPEGTRSPTGEMRPFKPGAFEIALRTRTPILPIVISEPPTPCPNEGSCSRADIRSASVFSIRFRTSSSPTCPSDELTAHVRGVIA